MNTIQPRCFIIEGCDNSGKDTIIKLLCRMLEKQPHIIHCVGIKKPTPEESIEASIYYYDEMFEIVRCCLYQLDVSIILNRSHIGDAVYGPIYRGYTIEESKYIYDLEDINPNHVVGIYVTANKETLMARDDGLSQSENNGEKIERELALFEDAIKNSRYKFTTIDTSDSDINRITEILQEIIDANI